MKGVLKNISNLQIQANIGIDRERVEQKMIAIIIQESQWEVEETPNTCMPIQSLSTFSFTIIGTIKAKMLRLANIK